VPLTQAFEPPWLRVEYWPETVVCVAVRRKGEPQEVLVVPTEGLTRAAERELSEWLSDHPPSVFRREVLRADGKMSLGEEAEAVLDLRTAEGLQVWLSAWAKVLAERDRHALALVQATARVEKELVYLVASGVFGITVVGLHAGWQAYLKSDYESKAKQLEAIQKQMDEYNQAIKTRTDKLTAEAKAVALLEGGGDLAAVVEKLRQRPARLLAALALSRPPQIVVTALGMGGAGWTIEGVSVDFNAPNAYASALEEAAKPLAIKVNPPLKSDFLTTGNPGENRGPWRFSLKLEDLGLAGMRDGVVR
jgi:Tfp pilus assembly protein PilN